MLVGCDSGAPVTNVANRLAEMGVVAVGRYYVKANNSDDWRFLSRQEVDRLFALNIGVIPLWQHKGERAEFTEKNGAVHAMAALANADRLKQPRGTGITACVDYDATDADIADRIMPYFYAFAGTLRNDDYKVGGYGNGNVCRALKEAGHIDFDMLACAATWGGTKQYKYGDDGMPETGDEQWDILQGLPYSPWPGMKFQIDPLTFRGFEECAVWRPGT